MPSPPASVPEPEVSGTSSYSGFAEAYGAGHSPDLCWSTMNAQLSLGGVSGELLPTDAEGNEWRGSA